MIRQTKKLRLDELQVQSFVTSIGQGLQTLAIVGASQVQEIDCSPDDTIGSGGTSGSGGTGGTGGTGGVGTGASQVESCQFNSVCRCTMDLQINCGSDSYCS